MRVLVVDDDAAAQRRCRAMLEAQGFEVHCESSLGSARRFLRTQRADAILMDLFLPDGCGYELLRVNADLLGGTPVVAMTGVYRGSAAARLLAARYPFQGVLPKPLEAGDLREALREVFGAELPGGWQESPAEKTVLTPIGFSQASPALSRGPETWPVEGPATVPNGASPLEVPAAAASPQAFVSPLDPMAQPASALPSASPVEVQGWDPSPPSQETQILDRREHPTPEPLEIAEEVRDGAGSAVHAAGLRGGRELGRPRAVLSAPRGVPSLKRPGQASESAVPARFDPRRAPLQGRLDVTPLPSLLTRLARARATGSLLLRRDQVKKIVYMEHGVPRAIKSNLLYECLGRMLVREGFLAEEVCERSVDRLKQERRPQGELLVEMGALSQRQVELALDRQFDEKLFDVFSWSQGLYRFRADELPSGLLRISARKPFGLILAGVRAASDPERLNLDLSDLMEQRPALRLPMAEVHAFGLSDQERGWLERMDGQLTLAELSSHGAQEGPLRLAYALLSLGVLGMEPG